jgi:voltage-gated potassium channel
MIARANIVKSPIHQALALAVSASIASGVRRGGTPLALRALGDRFREAARSDPMGALLSLVGGASVLFYFAERGRNPRVKTLTDAVLFITTCLSVGYADVFAKTETGKAIAAFVMTFGPAMSSAALDEGNPTQKLAHPMGEP